MFNLDKHLSLVGDSELCKLKLSSGRKSARSKFSKSLDFLRNRRTSGSILDLNLLKTLEGWLSEEGHSFWGLGRIWHKVGHVGPARETIRFCETLSIPLEDGNGCGIVEKHLIDILVLLGYCQSTTEVNVTLVGVRSDEKPICKSRSIDEKDWV